MGAVLSRSELEAALLMLDTNDNGKIEYDEFAGWWRAYQGGVVRESTARSPRAR
jgi:Ca2+-binding EF-hand superfamily protein